MIEKFIINEIKDKKQFIIALRESDRLLTLKECMDFVKQPLPITISEAENDKLFNAFCGCSKYSVSYEEIEEAQDIYPNTCFACVPSEKLIISQAWYDSLSEEDKEKVDCLIQDSKPKIAAG